MKRADFIKIIKLRSIWKVDKRKGNYNLPNGAKFSEHIEKLVNSQMDLDHLMIRENGDLCYGFGGKWNPVKKEFESCELLPDFEEKEKCSYDEQQKRIKKLVNDIIY